MHTYLFARPTHSPLGVAGVAVMAWSLRQARRRMRGSDYSYTGTLNQYNASHDYSSWWTVNAAKEYQEALDSYIANGGGDVAYVRKEYCIPSSTAKGLAA